MPVEFYKVFHLVGVFIVIGSLASICFHVMNGGTRAYANRKWAAMVHGIGLLMVLIGGMGMLAKLGYMSNFPGWAIAKLVIWLILGGLPALIYRKPAFAKAMWYLVVVLAGTAAWLAVYKP